MALCPPQGLFNPELCGGSAPHEFLIRLARLSPPMHGCWCLRPSQTALLVETQDIPVVSLHLLDVVHYLLEIVGGTDHAAREPIGFPRG
jgi:hypothetical protein